jgi:hypothetical protein
MLGRSGNRSIIAAALMMGLASAGGMPSIRSAPSVTLNAPRRAKKGLFGGHYSHNPMTYGHRGAGITMAQQKRASRKAKNVKRHRAASKG